MNQKTKRIFRWTACAIIILTNVIQLFILELPSWLGLLLLAVALICAAVSYAPHREDKQNK
jgi:hypothetical protein